MAAGVSTAPTGTLEVYLIGTSTPASVYSDPEGVTAVVTHTLDARGAIVRYVEGRVDCVVKNVAGATITSFTWGTDARDARVENLGFTGPNAVGAIVAGGRTTVDAVLTSLFGSLGAVDGQVLVNGVATNLGTAISSSAGLVYNIKSGYGAVGDGVANDAPAFQNMINAAATAGGGILYFPHGTYLINSAVSVTTGEGKFMYLGESAIGSIIKQGTSGITMLGLGASNNNLLLGLTFTATAANTGTLVSVGTGGRATFLGCAFGPLNGTQISCADSATSTATLINCAISQAGASSRIGDGSGATMRFVACDISTAGPDLTSFDDPMNLFFSGCAIAFGSAVAAGTATLASVTFVSLTGCSISCVYTSGTVRLSSVGTIAVSGCLVSNNPGGPALLVATGGLAYESGNDLDAALGTPVGGYSAFRDHARTSTTGSATSYTPSGEFTVHEVTSTGVSMAIANPSPDVLSGAALVILYENTSGGNITPTFGTAYSFVTAVGQVNAGNTGVFYFVPRGGILTNDLVCISPQPAGGTLL